MANTLFTDVNLTTSIAGYLANQLTAAGYKVHWQLSNLDSGTATQGTVAIVAEFPADPTLIVLPPHDASTGFEVILPAFSVQVSTEPQDVLRLGLGENAFIERATIVVDGYVVNAAQYMAFSTLFRNWFREDQRISIYDWESNATTPAVVETDVLVKRRHVTRIEFPDTAKVLRYYINMQFDLEYSDQW